MFSDTGELRTDCGFVDADRLAAEDLDALVGADLFGCLDWREEREPVATRDRPLSGDARAASTRDDGPLRDAGAMGASPSGGAMRTKIDWCGKCRTQMEHEIADGVDGGAEIASCLGCRQREATKRDLIAATAARNAERPWWRGPAIAVGACGLIAVLAVAGAKKAPSYEGGGDVDCRTRTDEQIRGVRDAADRACPCRTLSCAQAVMDDAELRGLLLDACDGATEHQRKELRLMFQALAVCVEVHR